MPARPRLRMRCRSRHKTQRPARRVVLAGHESQPGRIMKTYIMACAGAGFVKIGKSVNPSRRLGSVQTGCPYRIEIACVIDGDIESELHTRLHTHRVNGEWFRLACVPYIYEISQREMMKVYGICKDRPEWCSLSEREANDACYRFMEAMRVSKESVASREKIREIREAVNSVRGMPGLLTLAKSIITDGSLRHRANDICLAISDLSSMMLLASRMYDAKHQANKSLYHLDASSFFAEAAKLALNITEHSWYSALKDGSKDAAALHEYSKALREAFKPDCDAGPHDPEEDTTWGRDEYRCWLSKKAWEALEEEASRRRTA